MKFTLDVLVRTMLGGGGDLQGQFSGGADAEGLRRLLRWVNAAEHAEEEAGRLPGALVGLGDEVSEGRGEDHGEGRGLHLAGPLESHLGV